MEIYQLRYFVSVAETGNFTKAAAQCNISQPSLSQQIINLEEEFDQKLFHRLGRRVSLTPAGQLLLGRARQIITEADETLRELKEDPGLGHQVSVGAIPTVAHFFLPAVVAHCRANEIKINLHSREEFRSSVINLVVEGKVDWGLVSLPLADPRLQIRSLFTEPLLLAMNAAHPLATAPEITIGDLKEHNFVMLGDASSLTAQILQRASGEYEFEPRVTHRCSQLATVKTLTAMGLGLSILPRSARSANDPAGLVYRKLAGPPLTREIALIHHHLRHLSKGAKLFETAARAVVGPLPGSAPSPSPLPPGKTPSAS
jgi:LysR family hydrogen peroxide-inducible transcriptional activator